MSDHESNHSEQDVFFMRKCLELAAQAEGRTHPNPMVGALLVDASGSIVGSGFHKKSGTAHAEVIAFAEAGERAKGATLYVSLEPCCHFGKTPPCSNLVTASGVKRVVAAMVDPNPKVGGQGLQQISDAEIAVTVGVLQSAAEWQNRAFLKRIKTGLPWVCLKMASTLDGRIADRNGKSRWVTGPESRKRVHELRNRFDSVLVGGNTLRLDDPELTVRDIDNSRNPIRVALDARLKTAPSSRFCTTLTDSRTFLFADPAVIENSGAVYPSSIEVIPAAVAAGQINLSSVMQFLAQQGINSVLCEGGGKLAGSLITAGLVDEVYWVLAPKILADVHAKSAIALDSMVDLADAWKIQQTSADMVGNDIWIHGRL